MRQSDVNPHPREQRSRTRGMAIPRGKKTEPYSRLLSFHDNEPGSINHISSELWECTLLLIFACVFARMHIFDIRDAEEYIDYLFW